MPRDRFTGRIAGVGSTGGVRLVTGRWDRSPLGSFADVMVQEPGGRRILLAPAERVADYVRATYTFDEVRLGPVSVTGEDRWQISAPGLELTLDVGGPTLLGRALALVPTAVATSTAFATLADPVARTLLRGVRTRGAAGQDRREWYGATGVRAVTALQGTWQGTDLGALAPVDPPCTFGFSSTPTRPSVTSVVTTVERADDPAA